ncbi:hypothetical protein [Cesiribacter sp. SM1]|uniref:hypothetical protein n=1 Tax=Cesiribacter sp. SM1 TaxID=2861196 RepID=UPI001CD49B75|nr:hypothetical protein [Cesiribacter sp. SM1]
MKWISYLLSLISLMSCAEADRGTEGPSQSIREYYNVDSLLVQQIDVLAANRARLVKTVVYGGSEEVDTVSLTEDSLEQELQLFNEMNINRPVLSGRYIKTVAQKEGLEVTRYQADEPDDLRVNYLEVYRLAGQVQRLEALFSDRNYLYNSTRKLVLSLNEQQLPQTYSIEGIQKMIFKDRVEYSIEGRFIY